MAKQICSLLCHVDEFEETIDSGPENDEDEQNEKDDKGVNVKVPNEDEIPEQSSSKQESSSFLFSCKDVEDSIRQFNGKDGYTVNKWIEEFEEMAALLRWNVLQKLIFAKKSIDGLAKMSIQAEKGITTWGKLKDVLRREFLTKTSSAHVRQMLMTNKKKKNETTEEYYLTMREIAIEPEVVIQLHISDGITDDVANKIVLYGATSYEGFKKKLDLYIVITSKAKFTAETVDRRFSAPKPSGSKSKPPSRCFICGEKGHLSKKCPAQERGTKCFNCNGFGQKASDCRGSN